MCECQVVLIKQRTGLEVTGLSEIQQSYLNLPKTQK